MNQNRLQRVERHIVLDDENIDGICFLSKNLYNYCNYVLRQVHFGLLDKIPEYSDLVGEFEIQGKKFYNLDEYKFSSRLGSLNQNDYRMLPIQTSQQVIKLLYKNWKSFYKLLKVPDFQGRPRPPRYKHKTNGRNIAVFTNQQCRLKDGHIYFPQKTNLKPLKTKVDDFNQIRIIPQTNCFVIEVVYEKEVRNVELQPDTYLSIDIGLDNLATCVNNTGKQPFIVNGRPLKSINQYFNKLRSKYMSYVGDRGTSENIRRITHKRNNKIEDYLHKTSRFIVDYCVDNKLYAIIIGKNDGWKQKINIGKRNNQNFVTVPFARLIDKITYKAEEVGIKVVLREESYTSKCSFLDLEPIKKQVEYLGIRIRRGLFRSSTGKLINADVNGAYNILRKEVPNVFNGIDGIEGLGLIPLKVNLS